DDVAHAVTGDVIGPHDAHHGAPGDGDGLRRQCETRTVPLVVEHPLAVRAPHEEVWHTRRGEPAGIDQHVHAVGAVGDQHPILKMLLPVAGVVPEATAGRVVGDQPRQPVATPVAGPHDLSEPAPVTRPDPHAVRFEGAATAACVEHQTAATDDEQVWDTVPRPVAGNHDAVTICDRQPGGLERLVGPGQRLVPDDLQGPARARDRVGAPHAARDAGTDELVQARDAGVELDLPAGVELAGTSSWVEPQTVLRIDGDDVASAVPIEITHAGDQPHALPAGGVHGDLGPQGSGGLERVGTDLAGRAVVRDQSGSTVDELVSKREAIEPLEAATARNPGTQLAATVVEVDDGVPGPVLPGDDVRTTVAVDVHAPDDDVAVLPAAHDERRGRPVDAALGVTREEPHLTVAPDGDQVVEPVAVEVSCVDRPTPLLVDLRRVPAPLVHGRYQGHLPVVRHREVRIPVAVEVTRQVAWSEGSDVGGDAVAELRQPVVEV